MARFVVLRPILCLAFATTASRAASIETPCSNIQNAGEFTNATEIVEKLALLDNQEVMDFVTKAEQANVPSYNLYQCTYEYDSDPIIVATAICDASNISYCVALATYANNTQCKSATLCPDILNSRPSFTVDCSGIQASYPSCALTCSSKTSHVTGMETCTNVTSDATSPTSAPAGSDNKTSAATRRYMSLGSLSLLIGVFLLSR